MAIALIATVATALESASGRGIVLLVVTLMIGSAIGLWRTRVVEIGPPVGPFEPTGSA
jgi:hypothetical protein